MLSILRENITLNRASGSTECCCLLCARASPRLAPCPSLAGFCCSTAASSAWVPFQKQIHSLRAAQWQCWTGDGCSSRSVSCPVQQASALWNTDPPGKVGVKAKAGLDLERALTGEHGGDVASGLHHRFKMNRSSDIYFTCIRRHKPSPNPRFTVYEQTVLGKNRNETRIDKRD